jgi:hypothetical protein
LFSFADLFLEDLAIDYDRQTVEATTCSRSTVMNSLFSDQWYPPGNIQNTWTDMHLIFLEEAVCTEAVCAVTARPLSDGTVKEKLVNLVFVWDNPEEGHTRIQSRSLGSVRM